MDVLGWLSSVWKTTTGIDILEGKIEVLTATVKAQDAILYQVDKDKLQLAKDKIDLQKQVADLNVLNVSKDSAIESLKTELAVQGIEVPSVKPTFLGAGFCYSPNIQVEGEDVMVTNPPDIYTRSDLLARKLNLSDVKRLPKYAKVVKVWEYVINSLTYSFDKTDNWQFHPTTIMRKKGDCEDGTILFLDACRMVGIPASQAFNAVGNTSFGYHSYPIVWFEDADLVGTPIEGTGKGWYIFETTIDFIPDKPKRFISSQYWCEGGLQNWLYFGAVKNENKSDFNGVVMPSTGAGDIKRKRIEDSVEKRLMIIKHWKED